MALGARHSLDKASAIIAADQPLEHSKTALMRSLSRLSLHFRCRDSSAN